VRKKHEKNSGREYVMIYYSLHITHDRLLNDQTLRAKSGKQREREMERGTWSGQEKTGKQRKHAGKKSYSAKCQISKPLSFSL
jgi:hypothetical protein